MTSNRIAIGMPIINVTISDNIQRARILENENTILYNNKIQEYKDKEFDKIYNDIIINLKKTNSTEVNIKCRIRYNCPNELKQKILDNFFREKLPIPSKIYVIDNAIPVSECLCCWTNILCCCIPLPYWCYYYGMNNYIGDSYVIKLEY